MKCTVIIDKSRDEEVMIYAHERATWVEDIEAIIGTAWVGYADKTAVRLNVADVHCFAVEDNKVYAVTAEGKWQMKLRLYQIEEQMPRTFVKINQSCLANIGKIDRFEVSYGAALTVVFKNGYRDYVSRRQVKQVKERLGIQ